MADFSRSLDLSGASNFRDLGGYASQDGRLVRWRRIFRSDHLASLTPQDRQLLAGLGVARAVDFRGQAESAALSYELPHVRYQALPIEPIVVQRAKEMALAGHSMTAPIAVQLMQDYLLTNGLYRRPAGLVSSAPEEVLNVIWRVQAEFLQAALQAVDHDHGGVQRYLKHRLGMHEAATKRLAELYLQPHAA